MQAIFSYSVLIYFVFYAFESVIRYGFNLIGKDELIFIRDVIVILPLAIIFIQQVLHKSVHPAFFVYIFVILLHGFIMTINIGSVVAAAYSAKMLISMLIGAVAAPLLHKPGRGTILLFFLLWACILVSVFLDKYYVEFPWANMQATIGDYQVDISRDWQIVGEDKRAGGFTRSSIHVAAIEPLLAFTLIFHMRSFILRLFVALATVIVIYWSTQKGSMLAYMIVIGVIALRPRHPLPLLKGIFLFGMFLCITLPLTLPYYNMPSTHGGVFSFASFYMRIQEVWPRAWLWIKAREMFPFGVGLGGMSGAQRLYAPFEINYADNMFIMLYAFFGIMALFYMGFLAVMVIRVPMNAGRPAAQATAVLAFLFLYGCALSIIEDQILALYMGASIAWLCHEVYQKRGDAFEITNNITPEMPRSGYINIG